MFPLNRISSVQSAASAQSLGPAPDQPNMQAPRAKRARRSDNTTTSHARATYSQRSAPKTFPQWSALPTDLKQHIISLLTPKTVLSLKLAGREAYWLVTRHQSRLTAAMDRRLREIATMPRGTVEEQRAAVLAMRDAGALPGDLDIDQLSARKILYLSGAQAAISEAFRSRRPIDWRAFNSIPDDKIPGYNGTCSGRPETSEVLYEAMSARFRIRLTDGRRALLWEPVAKSKLFYSDEAAAVGMAKFLPDLANGSQTRHKRSVGRWSKAIKYFTPAYVVRVIEHVSNSRHPLALQIMLEGAQALPELHRRAVAASTGIRLREPEEFRLMLELIQGLPRDARGAALSRLAEGLFPVPFGPSGLPALPALLSAICQLEHHDAMGPLTTLVQKLGILFKSHHEREDAAKCIEKSLLQWPARQSVALIVQLAERLSPEAQERMLTGAVLKKISELTGTDKRAAFSRLLSNVQSLRYDNALSALIKIAWALPDMFPSRTEYDDVVEEISHATAYYPAHFRNGLLAHLQTSSERMTGGMNGGMNAGTSDRTLSGWSQLLRETTLAARGVVVQYMIDQRKSLELSAHQTSQLHEMLQRATSELEPLGRMDIITRLADAPFMFPSEYAYCLQLTCWIGELPEFMRPSAVGHLAAIADFPRVQDPMLRAELLHVLRNLASQ